MLRPWREPDASALALVLGDPDTERWTTTPQPYSADDALEWFATHPDAWRSGRSAAMAVVEISSERVVGSAELKVTDCSQRIGEIAYAVAPNDRRKGVGTRAAKLLSRWALGEVGLERLELFAHPENVASQRVAQKAGYVREGIARSVRVMRGQRVDLVRFSLIRSDLERFR
jgi:RimJ/RimL family protein N-acetyltransferase